MHQRATDCHQKLICEHLTKGFTGRDSELVLSWTAELVSTPGLASKLKPDVVADPSRGETRPEESKRSLFEPRLGSISAEEVPASRDQMGWADRAAQFGAGSRLPNDRLPA